MRAAVVVQEGPIRLTLAVVPGPGPGAAATCPGAHPDFPGQRCNRILMHVEVGGRQTVRCPRCNNWVRVANAEARE